MKFEEINLSPELMKIVQRSGFTELTAIQEKAIPLIREGKDIVGQSETGSGKTLAFGLPVLEKIVPRKGIQALILTPTRELCVQVADTIQEFADALRLNVTSVYGGVSLGPQIDAFQRAEIVVGTPGRILDHLQRRNLNFEGIRFLVLDEGDKMFEMGFYETVEEIINYMPKERQTLLFSATFPEAVHNLMQRYLHSPITIQTKIYVDKSLLKQVYYELQPRDKFSLLVHLLKTKTPGLAIVFCGTRQEVDVVSWNLRKNDIEATAIHGGLTQNKRLRTLDLLRQSKVDVLVATDVAARGLDIKDISHIYNYDVPKTSEDYVHRIGRTARAGAEGTAVTLLVDRDHDNFRRVLMDRSLKIEETAVPEFPRVNFIRQREESREGGYHRFSRPGEGFQPRRFEGGRGEGFQGRSFGGNRPERSNAEGRRFPSRYGQEGRRSFGESRSYGRGGR